ncbi:MAG: WD40 repeat domain-containing protein, partial [Nitrospiria bacterium]
MLNKFNGIIERSGRLAVAIAAFLMLIVPPVPAADGGSFIQKKVSLEGHGDIIRSVAFSPDGKLLVTGSYDKTVRIWDLETGRAIFSMTHPNLVRAVAVSPDGKIVASGNYNKTADLWDVETGKRKAVLGHSKLVRAVAFSPDGKVLASGSSDKK